MAQSAELTCARGWRAWSTLSLVALALGCGSKTGLPLGTPPPRDASPTDAPTPGDAGFDTFPCNWSYEEDIVVYSQGPDEARIGRIHGAVNELGPVALIAIERRDGPIFLRVDPAPRSVVRWTLDGERAPASSRAYASPDGFRLLSPDCRMHALDFDGALSERAPLEGTCEAGPAFEGRFAHVVPPGYATYDLATDTWAPYAMERSAFSQPTLTRQGIFDGFGEEVSFVAPGGAVDRVGVEGWVRALAPDPLNGGVAWIGDGPGIVAGRVADGVPRRLDTSSLPGDLERLSGIVTNETELLLVTSSAQLVFVPLNGSRARILPPFTESPPRFAELLLVDQGSAGGIAYVTDDDSGFTEVHFLSIVCNR